ncbi:MAG: metallophosphoesterase [Desulfobacterales bacterium]
MIKLLHVADLHLDCNDRERAYSLGVLNEIARICVELKVDCLLFAGDVFNSLADAEELRTEFRKVTDPLPCPVVYVPGNHEELETKGRDLRSFEWGDIYLLDQKPFDVVTIGKGFKAFEVLSVPHQPDYTGYHEWNVPLKKTNVRVAVAHGVVLGMSYAGPDIEEGGTAIDPDLFCRYEVDYAALGHIHVRPNDITERNTTISYAGSPRVWRTGESGPRGCLAIDLEPERKPAVRFVTLQTAGLFHRVDVPLAPDGTTTEIETSIEWSRNDLVKLHLSGMVEREEQVVEAGKRLTKELAPKVRYLKVDTRAVQILAGVADEPVARKFLDLWNTRRPPEGSDEYELWVRARQLGLSELTIRLEREK